MSYVYNVKNQQFNLMLLVFASILLNLKVNVHDTTRYKKLVL